LTDEGLTEATRAMPAKFYLKRELLDGWKKH